MRRWLSIGAAGVVVAVVAAAPASSLSSKDRITTFAGNGNGNFGGNGSGDGGPATAARIGEVYAIAVDRRGNLYLAVKNGVVRKVDAAGRISTIAGGPGANPRYQFGESAGVAADARGNV
jgi:hypothetical protein